MKLGVNNSVHLGTKKAALQLMDGGPSKINPPNSHPSNPIHKAAKQTSETNEETPNEQTPSEKTPHIEINKTAVIIGVVGVVALAFITLR